jgi:hypothetical protein
MHGRGLDLKANRMRGHAGCGRKRWTNEAAGLLHAVGRKGTMFGSFVGRAQILRACAQIGRMRVSGAWPVTCFVVSVR